MQIEQSERDGVVVLSTSGRFNMMSAPRVKTRIDETVAAGSARIVVDLSEVDFIDSSGLGALIGGLKTARQAGGDLRIAAAGEQVVTVLKLTNLDRILTPFDTVEDAIHEW
ncbi:STAS domain-containing protein [Nocardioides humilatus]|uniref:Anti-sigma factor antagonist n=1 Tax=Nocardioides humilatus TaxID=2607660 RepID=A0A5B1LAX4_9ACTN|nr:STAS domain-containing protein [Nocardioides humilatus]KAA1416839.1 STAS domain-containing protein [Nocardioides humilatus]